MTRKNEVLIAVGIIMALAMLLFFILRTPSEDAPNNTTGGTQAEDTADVAEVDPADIPAQQEVSASTIGRIFVERFGSYSTESGYTNIDDVVTLATAELGARLERLAEDARAEEIGDYYGVSTRIISTKTEVSTETEAVFLVTTQRQESFDTPGNTSVRYQDIRVSLVKEGESWLVSDFTWLE